MYKPHFPSPVAYIQILNIVKHIYIDYFIDSISLDWIDILPLHRVCMVNRSLAITNWFWYMNKR